MKFIKNFINKKKCNHSYHIIDTEEYNFNQYLILYCPKCNKEKCVNSVKYQREQSKSRLREKELDKYKK